MASRPDRMGTYKRATVLQFGTAHTDLNYGVHNNSHTNQERAILERVFFVKDKLTGVFRRPGECTRDGVKLLRKFRTKLIRLLPKFHPDTPHEFARRYQGRRQTIYAAAAARYVATGCQRMHSYIKAFIKKEKINFTAKPDPAPRLIQPRHPVYNVAVGRYIKKVEHAIYSAIARIYGGLTVAKGTNAEELGNAFAEAAAEFDRPVFVSLDAVRFDQHVNETLLRYEHSIYDYLYSGEPELRRLLEWQIKNKGFARSEDGQISYQVRGCRMSGDMNTALGNCILMCAMVWSFMTDMGVNHHRLLNNGDDCVVIFERRFLERVRNRLPGYFQSVGMEVVLEDPVFKLEHVEFCQTHPVNLGHTWTMVRNFPTSTAKDMVTCKSVVNAASFDAYRSAIGVGGVAAFGGVPVVGAFHDYMRRGSKRAAKDEKETGFDHMISRLNNTRTDPTDTARVSFYEAFGIEPRQQVHLEEYYDNITLEWSTPTLTECFHGRAPL